MTDAPVVGTPVEPQSPLLNEARSQALRLKVIDALTCHGPRSMKLKLALQASRRTP